MADYPFLSSVLPDLSIDEKPEMSFLELKTLFGLNLSEKDQKQFRKFHLYYDIENIRHFWKEEELNNYGNYNEVELEETLLTLEGSPEYVYRYLETFREKEERLDHFPKLLAEYFKCEELLNVGFLRDYFELERHLRLVMLGFRAKKEKRDLVHELRFEDSQDQVVMQILVQRDASTYIPPYRYEELKPLFEEHENNPMQLHRAITLWQFNKIRELEGVGLLSVERIMGYMARLIIVEKWHAMEQEIGQASVDQLVKACP